MDTKYNFMKFLVLIIFISLLTSCLMSGSPAFYNYKSRDNKQTDSLILQSLPNYTEFQYYIGKETNDSVYIYDPTGKGFKKMVPGGGLKHNAKGITFLTYVMKERWTLRKAGDDSTLVIKKFNKGAVILDTLFYHRYPKNKIN